MPDPRIWPIPQANDTFANVGLASAAVLAANPLRVDCDFTNDSASIIYLARGNAAVIGSGICLMPRGGTYHIGVDNLFLGVIYGISDDEVNLCISEGEKPR